MDGTTSRPVPPTPPPPGYYGDTRELLMKVMTPIIITFGTLGNILTVVVLLRQRRKMSSTSMYLLALSVSDLCLLWCSPLRVWLKSMWDIDIRYLSDVSCRTHLYFTYVFIHLSSWILVAVTVERTIGVVLPHKVRLCCTPRNAGLVITSLCVVIFGTDLVIPMISSIDGYQPIEGHAPIKCAPATKEFTEFRDSIWQWMDLSLTFLIPFVCLIIGNALIIWHLQKARKLQTEMKAARGTRGESTRRRGTLSLTILMIALCFIFFLTMTPVAVFQIYYPYRAEEIKELFQIDPYEAWERYQYFLLQHAIVNLVSYTNALFNFVLYVFSGTKFRSELKAALCCSKIRRNKLFVTTLKSAYSKRTNDLPKVNDNWQVNTDSTALVEQLDKRSGEFSSFTDIQYRGIETDVRLDAGYLGRDNLVFTSDDGISSISSILSKHVDNDTDLQQTETGDDESIDDVFTDSHDILIDGKELNGFTLHL